ncbi:MAG: conserved rane protein of unknown function [Parcubacteria group bacterium]|nr:conserved rane protein of unknown function [Parcubacteria group bacterium]
MKNFLIGLAVFVVLGSLLWFLVPKNVTQSGNSGTATSTTGANITPSTKTFTLADVAKHASASSCYSIINGGVYDLTAWINQHPGGQDAILSICGKDGSAAFNAQHGGQSRPESELAGFKIGMFAAN